MYMQPVVVQQPVMMMQPQMMMPPPQPQTIIINKNDDDDGDCPQCKKGNLIEQRDWTLKTCCVCLICPIAICCCPDFAYGKKKVCVACNFEYKI
jgi:hypothetical protein